MNPVTDSGLPHGRLEQRFAEKHPLLSPGDAAAEASRCLYCFDAPCMHACPTHIDVATFIRKIATGNLAGSAKTILKANLLGASCAKVCPTEVLCEGACVYVPWGRRPISIGRLQRYAMEKGATPELLERRPPTGRSIGLVGSGPASLACAGTLALLGHSAIVYEKERFAGGLNTSGVAPYKMPAAAALEEVEFVRSLGVRILTGVEVGRDITAGELLRRHDAVFLGVGLGGDAQIAVPGSEGPGVVGAIDWIARMKLDPAASLAGVTRAAVIGGGNTAIDAARELLQLGVAHVVLVHRRSATQLRAYRHEWDAAKREGVVFLPNAIVSEIVRAAPGGEAQGHEPLGSISPGGHALALRLVRARDGRPTRAPLPALAVDLVVVAIGQTRLAELARSFPGVAVDASGRIRVDPETFATGNPRVFAGGDAVNGGKEVVHAVAEGQAAARAIDAALAQSKGLRARASDAARLVAPAVDR